MTRRRTGCPTGRWSASTPASRVQLDPLARQRQRALQLRGVEFDYKTPRYHNYNVMYQVELPGQHAVEIGYVGTRGRNLETFVNLNNVTKLLPPGTAPAAVRDLPRLRPWLTLRAHRRRQLVRLAAAEVPAALLQGPAVPGQLHPERLEDQRRRLAFGRRRRRPPRAGRGRLEISRTTSGCRASTPSTRWSSAATTTCR